MCLCAIIYVCKWSNPRSFIDQRWGRWWAEGLLKIHLKWRWGFQLLTAVVLFHLKPSHTVTDIRSVQNSSLITFVIFFGKYFLTLASAMVKQEVESCPSAVTHRIPEEALGFFHSLAAVTVCVSLWLLLCLKRPFRSSWRAGWDTKKTVESKLCHLGLSCPSVCKPEMRNRGVSTVLFWLPLVFCDCRS